MATRHQRLIPGMAIGGRYRLIAPHGGRALLEFWQALDTASGQHVALTVVDVANELPDEFVHEILARTIRLRGLDTAGIAPVLDVLHTGAFGVVVSDWLPGASLREVADEGQAPDSVAAMTRALAAAAEAAHRAGLVLSVDDPARLRVGADGHVALAFPAVLPDTTPQTDLRGIGCALYALLVGHWPTEAQPEEPAEVDPRIPFLISTTTSALLRDNGGIGSAATLLTLLEQAAAPDVESTHRVMPPLPTPKPGRYAEFRNFGPEEQKEVARRTILRTGLGAAAAIVAVAILALASSLNGLLETNDDDVAMDADKLGLVPTTAAPQPPERTETVRGLAPGDRIPLEAATVFAPDGSPDSPDDAGLAIDAKPDTAWSTDRYYDADPFPKFKPGVGLLISLREPTPITAVTVDQNSAGSMIQVRGTDVPGEPKALADTFELTPATPVQPGVTRIPVTDPRPASRVVVWITKLGTADGQNRAAIAEIGVHAAAAPA
ncbi:protein kinase family protein [Mycolicibacterium novocastrense]|uniref:protein kinase family protein n=1 Tax=Mycolicibacterium novocastrense TaxID=59813 RepID=UPI0010568094|nr:protein kinase family protein [Mycolicibacterium novocastrense]